MINVCDFGLPKIIQSDRGREFVNKIVRQLCVTLGIDRRVSTAYHPRCEGTAESHVKKVKPRGERGIQMVKLCTCCSVGCEYDSQQTSQIVTVFTILQPTFVWVEDYSQAESRLETIDEIVKRNQRYTEAVLPAILQITREYNAEMRKYHNKTHDINAAEVFVPGTIGRVRNEAKTTRRKAELRAKRGIFVGYPEGQKGWIVLDPETSAEIVSRDVEFHEDQPGGSLWHRRSEWTEIPSADLDSDDSDDDDQAVPGQPECEDGIDQEASNSDSEENSCERPRRHTRPPSKLYDPDAIFDAGRGGGLRLKAMKIKAMDLQIPLTHQEAMIGGGSDLPTIAYEK